MFISLPSFEIADSRRDPHVPMSSDSRFWRGVGHSGAKPLLIATLHVGGSKHVATMYLEFEHDLARLLDTEDSHGDLMSLQRMTPPGQEVGARWRLDNVLEIWVGFSRHAGEGDVLRYRFDSPENRLEPLHEVEPVDHRELRLLKSFAAN